MPPDSAISPSHYKRGKIEAIEIIEEAIKDLPPPIAYNVGAALKYLLRAPYKGTLMENLQKSEWHIRRAVNLAADLPEESGC